MGRVTSQGRATGSKAAAKRSELGQQRHGALARIARLAQQANRVEVLEQRLAEETAARVELMARVATLELSLSELRTSLEVVVT